MDKTRPARGFPMSDPRPVLMVDDEAEVLEGWRLTLRAAGIRETMECGDSRKVMSLLETVPVEAVLLDLSMPHPSGRELLGRITETHPEVPVIIVTGINELETAVACMKAGAFDYLVKPVEGSRLATCVRRALEIRGLHRENRSLQQQLLDGGIQRPDAFDGIVAASPAMEAIFRYVEAVAPGPRPILITGESGVGKEMIARAIHLASGRTGAFLAVNIAGLDDETFADTLFGHLPGAFTGARTRRAGLVREAAGGTLFLDEIGDLSPASQIKLLRLLQEGEYYPLGSDLPGRADARILASTNRDLDAEMADGRFRLDLFYRLGTHRIQIPPLRQRPEDLGPLIAHFFEKSRKALNLPPVLPPAGLIPLLAAYPFPGNVRELEATIHDTLSRYPGDQLPLAAFKDCLPETGEPEGRPLAGPARDGANLFSDAHPLPTIRRATAELIDEALRRADGNQTAAARLLGISQSSLSKRLSRSRQRRGSG